VLSLLSTSPTELETISCCLIWDYVPALSPFTTHMATVTLLHWGLSIGLRFETEVKLRSMVSCPVCLGVGFSFWTHDKIWPFLLFVWIFLGSWCGAPSKTKGLVWILHCSQPFVQVVQDPLPYFAVSFETGPVRPLGTGFPLCRLLRLTGAKVEAF
jgi:hypothetical protein